MHLLERQGRRWVTRRTGGALLLSQPKIGRAWAVVAPLSRKEAWPVVLNIRCPPVGAPTGQAGVLPPTGDWSIIATMSTKLSVFCDKLIEGGWLAAVIVTPLYFNVYSNRVFEPDKLTLLRSIALFMALAWLVKTLETGLAAPPSHNAQYPFSNAPHASRLTFYASRLTHLIRTTPLVLPTLILAAVYVLSTITSVAPNQSLWGSYQRLQGTYTTFAYLTIFLLMLATLRTREQLDRLITTMILTSLPIALYGIIQHFGLDPLPWVGDVTTRVASTMGNSIFVAAYLIMVVPFTLSRLIRALSAILNDEGDAITSFLLASAYVFVLIAQAVCIFFTQSRGPWLGLLGGLAFFFLIWALAKKRRRLALGLVALYLVVGGLLVVINLPNSPLSFVREMPYVGRLGRVFELEGGTGKVRVLIWEGTVPLVTADPFRTLLGYGPETMHVAYNPYYPPDLAHYEARNASPDRSHNETFDALVITGGVGFAAYLFLFTSLFYLGLEWLGLCRTARDRNLFLALWLGMGVLAVLGFRLVDGSWRFFGVALPAGMMVGLFLYLVWQSLTMTGSREADTTPLRLLLIGLYAAVVAHFIEIHFGIAIAATRTYFWAFAALMVLAGYLYRERPELVEAAPAPAPAPAPPSPSPRRRKKRRQRSAVSRPVPPPPQESPLSRPLLAYTFIVTLILATMVYDFKTPQVSLFKNLSMVWLFALSWIFFGLIVVAESQREAAQRWDGARWLAGLGTFVLVTLVGFFVFAGLQEMATTSGDLANVTIPFYLFMLLTLGILAGVLLWGERLPRPAIGGLRALLYPAVAVLVAIVVFATNVNVVRADVYYKQAWVGFHQRGQYDPAIQLYERALALQPGQDFYMLFLGKALIEKAQGTADPAGRENLFQQARQKLEEAQRLNPLNTDHTANLARMYQIWAQTENSAARRQELLQRSLDYYQEAVKLSPNAAHLYNEWATTYMLLGDYERALEKLQKSLALDQQFDQTYLRLGELYRTQGQWEQAAEAYRNTIRLNPNQVQAHSALGYVYSQLGRLEDAVTENLKVLELAPNDLASHRNLALLYHQLGRPKEALEHGRAALALAPEDKALQDFVAALEQSAQ